MQFNHFARRQSPVKFREWRWERAGSVSGKRSCGIAGVWRKLQTSFLSAAGRGVGSVADLTRKLHKYIGAYARSARPFRWTCTDPQKRIHINEITGTAYYLGLNNIVTLVVSSC